MIVRGGLVKKWKQVTFYFILCEIQTRTIETAEQKWNFIRLLNRTTKMTSMTRYPGVLAA